jgi:hypothetical protein
MEDRESTIREGKRAHLPFSCIILTITRSTHHASISWSTWNS